MAEGRSSVLHQQALVVMSLFTGFALTSLVLILQSPANFHADMGSVSGDAYFALLISLVALVASASLFGVLATMEVAGGLAAPGSGVDRFGYACFLIGLAGFVVVLPLLILPFTSWGGLFLLSAEVVLLFVYFMSRNEPPFQRTT